MESKGKRGSVGGKGAAKPKGKHAPEVEVEEEVIDLEDVGRRGVI